VTPDDKFDDDGYDEEEEEGGSALAGLGELPDISGLLDQFQKVQAAQSAVFEGRSGAGAVRVTATGNMEFQSVMISPDAVDASDVSMLEDLVLAALHDLTGRIAESQRAMLGNLDLGGLGGLFGGDTSD
jgi:DNA-binding protein YbaB